MAMNDAEFRWNDWNAEHATSHGCTIPEIESVVRHAGHGWPRHIGDEKYRVVGRGTGDRMVQVIFTYDPPPQTTLYVIHAMPLTTRRRRSRPR